MTVKLEIEALPHLGPAGLPAPAPAIDISRTLETSVDHSFVPFSSAAPPLGEPFGQTVSPAASAFTVAPVPVPPVEVPATLDVARAALPQVVVWRNSGLYRPGAVSTHSPRPAVHIRQAPHDQESS